MKMMDFLFFRISEIEKINIHDKAIAFLDSQNDNLYFEIICDE